MLLKREVALCLILCFHLADGIGGEGTYVDHIPCCAVGENVVGDYDLYAGWYDVRRCGECNDYCFWMSDPDAAFDPAFRPGTDPWHTPSELSAIVMPWKLQTFMRPLITNHFVCAFFFIKVAYNQAGEVKGFFTCILSGTGSSEQSTDLSFLVNDEGVTTFPYRKCEGKGAPTHRYRMEEYMGCWRVAQGRGAAFAVGVSGRHISLAQCADACRSKGYHYFGRRDNGRCSCGGVTLFDLTHQRYGPIDYGPDYCQCDSTYIGPSTMACVYRLVDQWDPDSARQLHECYHFPSADLRKLCYISCRDESESLTNMFMCKTLRATSLQHLNRSIARWYDESNSQLHILGGDISVGGGGF